MLQEQVVLILENVARKQPAAFDDALPLLTDALPELTVRDRTIAMRAIALLDSHALDAVDVLRPYAIGLRGRTVYERAWSAAALIRINCQDERAAEVLIELLESMEVDDRIAGVAALAFSVAKADRVVAALRERMLDTDVRVRTVAARALWNIGSKPSDLMPTLRQALREPVSYVNTLPIDKNAYLPSHRVIAMSVISKIGAEAKDAVPELISLLKSDEQTERWLAIDALGAIGPDASAAVDPLQKLANSYWDWHGYASAAKRALSKIVPDKQGTRRSRS
jgi:hypothetical protein